MADAPSTIASTKNSASVAILIIASSSVLVTRARRLRRGRLRLITRRRCACENFMDGRWPRSHVHTGVALRISLVKVGIPIIGAMVPVQVDRQNLQDRRTLCSKARKQIRTGQDVVEVVVEHVQVIEDRRSLWELPGEI